jgi:hypothetical protein
VHGMHASDVRRPLNECLFPNYRYIVAVKQSMSGSPHTGGQELLHSTCIYLDGNVWTHTCTCIQNNYTLLLAHAQPPRVNHNELGLYVHENSID